MKFLIEYKTFFLVAFTITIPLISYAIFLQWRILSEKKKPHQSSSKGCENIQNQKKRQESLDESIRIISLATIQGQCEISEACIRLANLIPLNKKIAFKDSKYEKLFLMYEEIKHLKTHRERKNLPSADRFKEDNFRFRCEEKYKEDIDKICKDLYEIFKKD